jgi:hypothetical protein
MTYTELSALDPANLTPAQITLAALKAWALMEGR